MTDIQARILSSGLLALVAFPSLGAIAQVGPDSLHQLALLVAAPWGQETAMHNDLVRMKDALMRRGMRAEEIMTLDGNLNAKALMDFISKARARTSE